MEYTGEIKPCPFCGHEPIRNNLIDSLHPTNHRWFKSAEMCHDLFNENIEGHIFMVPVNEPMPPVFIEEQGREWRFSCLDTEGGCGVELHGFSEEDVMQKWNRRA